MTSNIRISVIKRFRETDQIAISCGFIQIIFALVFVVQDWSTLPVGIPTVISLLYLTFIPGLLLLGNIGIDLRRPEAWIYVITASLVIVMVFGAIISVLFAAFPTILPRPFTLTWLPIYLLSGTILLYTGYLYNIEGKNNKYPTSQNLSPFLSKESVLSIVLVTLAVSGSQLLENYELNLTLLYTLILCALTPFILFRHKTSTSKQSILLFGIALTLLYQKSLVSSITGGDIGVERRFAELTLTSGYWMFNFSSPRITSLRITVLHPVHTLLSELNLFWEFRIIHPLLFALIPVIIYYAVTTQFNAQAGVAAALVYIFSHPFFSLLSLNTRTGQSLFFVGVFILASVDYQITYRMRSTCLLISALGIFMSHYAVGPLFMFVLMTAWLINKSINLPLRSARIPLSYPLFLIIIIIGAVWYMYSAGGNLFQTVVGMIGNIIIESTSGGGVGETGSNAASLQLPSLSYQIIRYEYVVVLGICGIGLILTLIRLVYNDIFPESTNLYLPRQLNKYTNEFRSVHLWYLLMGGTGALIGPMAFFPSVSFGPARMYIIIMTFTVGFFGGVFNQFTTHYPKLKPIIIVIFTIMILINTGVVAAIVTNDVSPQPNLMRNQITEEGDNTEIYHLSRRWTPHSDKAQSTWANMYLSPSRITYRGSNEVGRGTLINSNSMCDGYIYITYFDNKLDEVVVDPNPDFVYYDNSISIEQITSDPKVNKKIYESNNNMIMIRQC